MHVPNSLTNSSRAFQRLSVAILVLAAILAFALALLASAGAPDAVVMAASADVNGSNPAMEAVPPAFGGPGANDDGIAPIALRPTEEESPDFDPALRMGTPRQVPAATTRGLPVPDSAPSRAAVEAAIRAEQTGETLRAPTGAGANGATRGDSPEQTTPLQVNTTVAEAVRPGGRLEYVVHYTNTHSSTVNDVVVEDTMSQGQAMDGTFTATPAIDPASVTIDGPRMIFRLGSLPAGRSGVIRFETIVDNRPEPSRQQNIILVGNSVKITGHLVPDTEDSAVATVVGPILELLVSDGPDPTLPGHRFTYTFTLKNLERQDAVDATSTVISAVLPADVAFVSASNSAAFVRDTRNVVWRPNGTLAPGGEQQVTVSVQVSDTVNAPTQIRLDRDEHVARSAEIQVDDVMGTARNITVVNALLQKEAEGPRRVGSGASSYPGDNVTYTVTIHNPRNAPMSGVVLSDTIPGDPANFEFVRALSGAPPVVTGNILEWTDIKLEPWGSASYSYVAHVPRDAFISDNAVMGSRYGSDLAAVAPTFDYPPASNVALVRVFPPILMNLVVSDVLVQAGTEIAYTITLQNRGTEAVSSIRLTDTMEGPEFRYVGMLAGPSPEGGTDPNVVVWRDLSIPGGGELVLAFDAIASGLPLTNFTSDLVATTPETSIPARTNVAPVRIDSPLRIDKTSDQQVAYLDSEVRYDLVLSNVTQQTWMMNRITDTLPAGFYHAETGRSAVVLPLDPPVQIRPGEDWSTSYSAYISGDIPCRNLPGNYATARGQIQMRFLDPMRAVFGNASQLADLEVRPHVATYVTATREALLPGDQFTYELRLVNETDQHGTNTEFVLTVPEGFSYVRTLEGPVATRSGDELRFNKIQIAPKEDRRILVEMRAGQELGQFASTVAATAEGIFCVEQQRGDGPVRILEDVVEIQTKPLTPQAAPGGNADFEITFFNRDRDPYPISAVTNTLPAGFSFVEALRGAPEPSSIDGTRVRWNNIVLPGNSRTTWQIRTKASTLFGSYTNYVEGFTPETRIRPATSDPVTVMPMVQLTKLAGVDQAAPGDTVPYTITLLNQTSSSYSTITITDVLPAEMTYERMLLGPAPAYLGPDRTTPVWRNLSVGGRGGLRTLVFEAKVRPDAAEVVAFNEVIGSSPDVLIPGTDKTAPVAIDSDFAPPTATPRNTATSGPPPPTDTPGLPETPSPTATRDPALIPQVYLPWMQASRK